MLRARIETREIILESGELSEYRVRYIYINKDSIKNDIIQFKDHGQKNLGRVFGECIYENLPKNYDLSIYDYLLPVPSKPSSFSKRGYNPAHLIGKRLSKLCGLCLIGGILKAVEGPSQRGRTRDERLKNPADFDLIDPSRVQGKGFLVLDDVLTTGSTLNEVIRTLSTASPRRLDALVFAKTPSPYLEGLIF